LMSEGIFQKIETPGNLPRLWVRPRFYALDFDTKASFVSVLYAFDILELDGEDLRRERLEVRKGRLAKALRRVKDGIQFNEHIEEEGGLVFKHACKLGLEGIIAKRLDMPYRSGRCKSWIKVKNPLSPAMLRIEDGSW
ncbi:MAG: hypothetical protein H0V50_04835, partial [Thermoleophilaceae bacterium]|nr:hypothetical protein [Thermoleophilaceae bacterium]